MKLMLTYLFIYPIMEKFIISKQLHNPLLDKVWMILSFATGALVGNVETEYCEMLFQLETEQSDKELYRIIVQSRPMQMISY